MTQLRIHNARVIDPAKGVDAIQSINITDGCFSDSCDDTATVIDANGLIACPGFIDLFARLREPGASQKGTIKTESLAALKAGFTTVFCSPNTNPVIDSTATVELIKQKAMAANGVRVAPIGALSAGLEGQRLSEMATLNSAGCLILGHADKPMDNTGVLLSAMKYASSFDIPITLRALDTAIAGDGCAHAGSVATRLGLPGISVVAESVAIAKLIELCRSTRCRLHFSRLSAARSIELISIAKQQGLPITADVGIHHLYFTHEQIEGFDANFHSEVPFRTVEDRDALRMAVKNGTIDAICSDHAPHDIDAKLAPFASSASGISAFDSFLPLLLGLPDILKIPLADVIAKVTSGPARIVNTKNEVSDTNVALFSSGAYSLAAGRPADLVLIDPHAIADLSEDTFLSHGKNSPLLGLDSLLDCTGENVPMKGCVKYSIVGGQAKPHVPS